MARATSPVSAVPGYQKVLPPLGFVAAEPFPTYGYAPYPQSLRVEFSVGFDGRSSKKSDAGPE